MFNKASKKLHKSSQRHLSLGIPTNIAAGPLGFRAELDIGPKGERSHPFGGDRPDSTAMLDESDVRASQIVFNDRKSEGQGLPVPGPSTLGATVGGDGHGTGPLSECFRSLLSLPMFTRIYVLYPSGENTGEARNEEEEPAKASMGTWQSGVLIAFC